MDSDILNIYCPSCGGPAEFDIVHQYYECRYCGGKVQLEDAKEKKKKQQQEIRKRVVKEVKNFPLMTTSCSGCGASLVFEENEASATCQFCGRNLIRKRYTQGDHVPEAIIPFALTEKEAKNRLEQWCLENKSRKESKLLLTKIDSLKGYYLPYEMVRGPVACEVNKTKQTVKYTANGYLQDSFVNASKQLDNLVLDSMEPYDLNDLKEFDYAFVAGQRLKAPDINSDRTFDRLKEEAEENYRVLLEKIWGSKAIDITTKVDPVLQAPVLLPVYYLKDGDLNAAVNGQTGKVSVRAMKSSVYISLPWWLQALFLLLTACLLTFGIGFLASGNLSDTAMITGVLAFFYLFVFCFMFEPGLDNTGSISYYQNIYTSGEQTFRREKGSLVLRDDVIKRRIAEPVFLLKQKEGNLPVTYIFRSKKRILSMIMLAMLAVFFPVILALFVNGFNFAQLELAGSGVWFCIAVPTVPILLIQLGLKELYNNPWIYVLTEDGKKKRYYGKDNSPVKMIKEVLKVMLMMCLHPLGWIIYACLGVMVYLTAFGFDH